MLGSEPIFRAVSSPYVRCVETIAPVAEFRDLPVEEADELAEGLGVSDALRLIDKVADKPTVLCTHGDVVENLLTYLRDRRVPLDGEFVFPKGSTWVLDADHGEIVRGRYLPPTA
jgi:broad specificity phosphatase PhoE